jgi:hypothetical protein
MNVFGTNKLIGGVASVLALLLLALAFVFSAVDRDTLVETIPAYEASAQQPSVNAEHAAHVERPANRHVERLVASLKSADESVREDVLWLARAIYSETKRPAEQELIAWVVRNRVETGYRGQRTYRGVVLDPWQFSAFNENGPRRSHYLSLGLESKARGWATAIAIAYDIMHAPAYERPFSQATRHFYSEISMLDGSRPEWAIGKRPVSLDRDIDPRRFRFYAEIA